MSRYPRDFGRRQFLVAATGLLAIPTLESLVPRGARAAVQRAVTDGSVQRLVCVHSCHGWTTDQWVPAQAGANFSLSRILQPLANVKDKTLVFSKMQNDAALRSESPGPEDTHAKGMATLFTGANLKTGGQLQKGMSPSMDYLYANFVRQQPNAPTLPALNLGLRTQGENPNNYPAVYMQCISYSTEGVNVVDEVDPQRVFSSKFIAATGSSTATAQTEAALRAQRKSVLDAVLDQANSLKGKLGQDDAERLDQYFTGIRDLEVQFSTLTNPACAAGAAPASSAETDYQKRADAFMDLVVLAFSCDLTRAVSFNFGTGHNNHIYKDVEATMNTAHHDLTHALGVNGNPERINKVNTWEVGRVARMLEGLKAVKEGSATALDNSVTLISTEVSVAGQHGYTDLPVVVVGGAGGKIDGGRHVVAGSNGQYGNLTELQLGILQALGTRATTFGGFGTSKAMSLKA